jgi:hypothetical protein
MKKIHMLEFLRKHLKEYTITEVTLVDLMSHDTDLGKAGEHYLVKFSQITDDFSTTIKSPKKLERTCLVNTKEFDKWLRKKEIIKFID